MQVLLASIQLYSEQKIVLRCNSSGISTQIYLAFTCKFTPKIHISFAVQDFVHLRYGCVTQAHVPLNLLVDGGTLQVILGPGFPKKSAFQWNSFKENDKGESFLEKHVKRHAWQI